MDPYRDPYREADASDPYAQPGHIDDQHEPHTEEAESEWHGDEHESESDPPGLKMPAVTCAGCTQAIPDFYYRSAGHRFCYDCASGIQERLIGGSPTRRFSRATLLGILAGVAGCVVYYVIREVTGRELAIVAIGVGYLVGTAVARGADHRGGWVYQLLAVFLTYTAIVLTNVPQIIQLLNQGAFAPQQAANNAPVPAAAAGGAAGPAKAGKAVRPAFAPNQFGNMAPWKAAIMLVLLLLAALAVLMITAYVLPILVGFHHPMLFLILGFALYEAWMLNRRHRMTLEGPFAIDPTAGPTAGGPAPSPA